MTSGTAAVKKIDSLSRVARAAILFFLAALTLSALQPASKTEIPAANPTMEESVRLYYEGEIEDGILSFEKILQSEPENSRVRKQLAELYRETGDYNRVIELLGEIWRLGEASPRIERELFVSLCLAGKNASAAAILPLSEENAETIYYEALLLRDRGDVERAAERMRKSLLLEERRPMGWFFLGGILQSSSPAEAETCFRTALKQDPSFTDALLPLAETVLLQGRHEDAYNLLLRARNAAPSLPGLAERIEEARALLPDIGKKWAESAARKKEASEPPRAEPISDTAGMPVVRVGLAEGLSSVTFKTGADFTLRRAAESGGPPPLSGRRHEILKITARGGVLEIRGVSEEILLRSTEPVVLEYSDAAATTLVFDFVSEAGSFFSVTEDRAYRGRVEFRPAPAGITLINALNIEEYLYGVLPAEMPPSWPAEALKAQAVAARSYTLAYLGTYESKGFDLYGSVLSAAYRGVVGERRAATEAVDATRGVYMTAGGEPLRAYYSANHGGYSEDSLYVWGADAHMRAVPDKLVPPREDYLPIDDLRLWIAEKPSAYSAVEKLHTPSAYRWEKWIRAGEIADRIGAEGNVGRVLKVFTRGRGISGRVREVEIVGTEGTVRIKGDKIRSRLGGLRSSLFIVKPKFGPDGFPEYFIFQGAGWGHGVGLDQSGAAGMASAGYTAEEILRHYYPKAERAEF